MMNVNETCERLRRMAAEIEQGCNEAEKSLPPLPPPPPPFNAGAFGTIIPGDYRVAAINAARSDAKFLRDLAAELRR